MVQESDDEIMPALPPTSDKSAGKSSTIDDLDLKDEDTSAFDFTDDIAAAQQEQSGVEAVVTMETDGDTRVVVQADQTAEEEVKDSEEESGAAEPLAAPAADQSESWVETAAPPAVIDTEDWAEAPSMKEGD